MQKFPGRNHAAEGDHRRTRFLPAGVCFLKAFPKLVKNGKAEAFGEIFGNVQNAQERVRRLPQPEGGEEFSGGLPAECQEAVLQPAACILVERIGQPGGSRKMDQGHSGVPQFLVQIQKGKQGSQVLQFRLIEIAEPEQQGGF